MCCDFIRHSPNFHFTVYPGIRCFVEFIDLWRFCYFQGCRVHFCQFCKELVRKINRVNKHQTILRLTHVVELETNSDYQLSKHFSDKMMIYCWKKKHSIWSILLWTVMLLFIHIILFGFKLLRWQLTFYKCIVLQK